MNRLAGSTPFSLQYLEVALGAALEAGAYFRSRIDSIGEVKTKSSPSDLVTDVDPACEQMIRARITQRFADHQILGEETTAPGAAASIQAAARVDGANHLWIVDPLDGTTNFVHGLPLSVVSIAYAENGVVQVGVIFDPYRNEAIFAIRGYGTRVANADAVRNWLNAVSPTLPGHVVHASKLEDLRRSVVATGIPTRSAHYERTTRNTVELLRHIKSIRALGAAALHLAYIACGRLDVFWEYDLNAWDLAAGCLLVEESGGRVKELGGGSYHLRVRDILVAGTQVLVDGVEAILMDAEDTRGAVTE